MARTNLHPNRKGSRRFYLRLETEEEEALSRLAARVNARRATRSPGYDGATLTPAALALVALRLGLAELVEEARAVEEAEKSET